MMLNLAPQAKIAKIAKITCCLILEARHSFKKLLFGEH